VLDVEHAQCWPDWVLVRFRLSVMKDALNVSEMALVWMGDRINEAFWGGGTW